MGKKTIICFLLCTYLTQCIFVHFFVDLFFFFFFFFCRSLYYVCARVVWCPHLLKAKIRWLREVKVKSKKEWEKEKWENNLILIGSVTERTVLRKRSSDARGESKSFYPSSEESGLGPVRGVLEVVIRSYDTASFFSRSHGCRHDLGMERIIFDGEG